MTDSATLSPRAPEAARFEPLQRLEVVDGGTPDGQLLDRFLLQRDHQAFASLVHRHGPMVLGVCRRLVGNPHDADDAFQATFLVLVRRAETIRPREMVGPWLYGVAYRTALTARQRAARRLAREKSLVDLPDPVEMTPEPVEAWPELDHAIHRLPEIYRRPVVLCELQGKPRREAARLLGVAEGTLSSRLASARKRLARHLHRRGVLNSVALGSLALFTYPASAQVPPALTAATLHSAAQASAAIPAAVAQLTQGAIRSMFFSKCKSLLATALLVGCLGGGASLLAGPVDSLPQDRQGRGDQDKRKTDRKPARQQGDNKNRDEHGNREKIEGSGNIITETRKISGVSVVNFTFAGKVTIKQTGRESLTLKGDDNILPLVDTKVEEGTLTIGSKQDVNINPSKETEFIIEVKNLKQVDQRGAGEVTLSGYNGKELTINLLGAGDMKLDGKASTLTVNLAGAGNIDAEKLTARDAVVDVRGAGNALVNATGNLEANVRGVGNIEYVGEPKVQKSIQGIGNVGPAKPGSNKPGKSGKKTIKT